MRLWNQGGKRKGSVAFYVEPWHSDIKYFLDLKRNTGSDDIRARDLFLALWIPDLFMERVVNDGMWSLMCPHDCPGLGDVFGDEFKQLYEKYEAEGKYTERIKARDLFNHILELQIEAGGPYMLYKDACNEKSNQKNLGIIKSSNLCTEIIQYSSPTEYAVCNLASICLPKFIIDGVFNYELLFKISRIITRNLDRIIDINFYPVEAAKKSNMKNRPIGIGVQGLADVFAIMGHAFDSEEARQLNKNIFETIYYGSLFESNIMAKELGPYSKFKGSPFSEGKLQFDLWGVNESSLSGMWDWPELRKNIIINGTRNSLCTTIMPTATTSQINGNNECIEPYTSNLYMRETLAGNFKVFNKHLMRDLSKIGLWTDKIKNKITYYKGSVQKIKEIPDNLKLIYRTVWEIPQASIIEMAADRGIFIDQSQSMNLFIDKPNYAKLTTCHIYAWKKGLKTGMYYLRSKPSVDPIQFGLDIDIINDIVKEDNSMDVDSMDIDTTEVVIESPVVCKWRPKHLRTDEDCVACSS
jgi:ribonucleoside-diphosphate reductase alpha subunit